jgi:hypothetical protein
MSSFRTCPARRPLPALPYGAPSLTAREHRRFLIDCLTVQAMFRPGVPCGVDFLIRTRSIPRIGARAAMLILLNGSCYVRNDPARIARCRDIIAGIR